MSEDLELEAAVAAYRAELSAAAHLARTDLDEIEDHLRTLVDELRAAGRGATAIAEARRRLGEPHALAREHARVRSRFGTRPSRAQAWSAALLLAPLPIWAGWSAATGAPWSRAGVELALTAILCAALVARQAWARAIALGHAAALAVSAALALTITPSPQLLLVELATGAGAAAFLWPRRRGDLPAAGVALGLLVPAYNASIWTLAFQRTDASGHLMGDPLGQIAMWAVLAAAAGMLLRARWGAIAAGVAAIVLAWSSRELFTLHARFAHPDAQAAILIGTVLAGALAAAVAATLSLREQADRRADRGAARQHR